MSDNTKTAQRSKPTGRRQWVFRIFALTIIPTLFFGLVELGLALGNVGYPTSFVVSQQDHLVDNYRFAWRFFPRQLARTPQPLRVSKENSSSTRRIVVLGGSAAMGDPEPAFGMPRILAVLLQDRFPDERIEVINAAVTAINSHVVRSIADDCQRRLQPDGWAVYMGNNEVHGPFGAGTVFGGAQTPRWLIRSGLALQKTRLGQAVSSLQSGSRQGPKQWGGMKMFLKSQVSADSDRLPRVYDNFEANLTRLIGTTQKRGAVTVLSTVASNLRDSPPFASVVSKDLTSQQSKQWQSLLEQGVSAQQRSDHQQALSHFEEALAVDDQHAELLFRRATAQLALYKSSGEGQLAEAKSGFRLAREHDALRFRADSQINDRVRQVANNHDAIEVLGPADQDRTERPIAEGRNLYLLDFEQELESLAEDGIPGAEYFHEHVHFNFRGNYALALRFAQTFEAAWNLTPKDNRDWLTQTECERRLGFSAWHQLMVHQEMQGRLNSAPFTQQCFHQERMTALEQRTIQLRAALNSTVLTETLTSYQQLLTARPNDWMLHEMHGHLLESIGKLDEAADAFQKMAELLPHRPEPAFQQGRLLNKQRKWELAEKPLRRALRARPDFARAANSLGIALSQQGKFEESISWFQQAIQVQPSFGEAVFNWGLVLAGQGQDEAAKTKYQAAVEADPNYVPAHARLGQIHAAAEQWDLAREHYLAISELQPTNADAALNLGVLYAKQIDDQPTRYLPLAIEQFEKVLRLSPKHQYAQKALQHLRLVQAKRQREQVTIPTPSL